MKDVKIDSNELTNDSAAIGAMFASKLMNLADSRKQEILGGLMQARLAVMK